MVAVRDESTDANIIYVDGVEQGQNESLIIRPDSTRTRPPLTSATQTSDFYFDGLIDEVALYDRALPQDEIQSTLRRRAGMGNGVQSLRPAPAADAGDDQADVKETTVVTLDGTVQSPGYAGATITYLWEQMPGTR